MKLLDAYVGESNQIGSWSLIGYTGPGTAVTGQTDSTTTTNFNYGGCDYKGTGDDGKAAIGGAAVAAKIGWVATSKAALNDVAIGAQWTLAVEAEESKSLVKYTATVPTGVGSLTPNFEALSH